MLTPFNRIYDITLDFNALETTHDTKALYTIGDNQTSVIRVTFTNGNTPLDLTGCKVWALIRDEIGNVYRQDAGVIGTPTDGVIGIDIKKDDLLLGTNDMALRIFKDNGDVLYSPTMHFKVLVTILDGTPINVRIDAIQRLKEENEKLKLEIERLKKELENR